MRARPSAALALILLPLLGGCGGGASGGQTLQVPELGLSIEAPAGWRVDRQARMFSRGDSTCMILEEPLEGADFLESVDRLSGYFGGQLISREQFSLGGRRAVRAVIDYPGPGSRALKAYIDGGDTLVEVSFVADSTVFDSLEPEMSRSLESLSFH